MSDFDAGPKSVEDEDIKPSSVKTDAVLLGDDQKAILGANDDYAIIYDATDDRLEFRDQSNNTTAYMPRSAAGNITGGGDVVVNVEMGTDQSISANTWTTVDYDTEVTDVNSTYDLANDQWSPSSDGDYLPIASVSFNVGADGDRIAVRIRNVTDGVTVAQTDFNSGGPDPANVKTMRAQEFLSSKTYEVQANNLSSSDTLVGATYLTNFTVVSI